MRIGLGALLFSAAAVVLAQNQQPAKSADQLRDFAKQARKAGDLQAEAGYLCQAAGLDSNKYEKKCEKAKEDASKALLQFQTYLDKGRTEIERKDYSGALDDLGKITFGPARDQAQQLILRARIESGTLSPEQFSQLALIVAGEAFSRGDFDRAEDLLKRVQSPAFQPAANRLELNINTYRDAMKQADELDRRGDHKGAAEKYQSAATIRPNGPGQPLERMRQALDAQAKADNQAKADKKNAKQTPPPAEQTPPPSPPVQQAQVPAQEPVTPSKVNNAEKIKNWLAIARRDETGGNLKGALQAYEAALKLDERQPDASAGRTRVLNQMKDDEQAHEKNLVHGIAEFYASRFSGANNVIRKYLENGGGQHAGAAHFYLGASLLSQAILADPKNTVDSIALRQQALEQFVLAKQLHYVPSAVGGVSEDSCAVGPDRQFAMTDEQASRFDMIQSTATVFRIEAAGLSDVGLTRSNNEDSFGLDLDRNIFVVCDGMGGMAAGEVASSIAVDHTLQAYRDLCTDDVSPYERLHCAIASANSAIWQMARDDDKLRGMGTTLVAACVNGKHIVVGNVGDSRAYFLRDDACVQITDDHSCKVPQEFRGEDGQSSSTSMPRFITRAVGAEAIVKPDFFVAELEPGDMILLATDGLTRYLDPEKISKHIRRQDDLRETCRSLIATVYARGAEDNVTCLLLRAC